VLPVWASECSNTAQNSDRDGQAIPRATAEEMWVLRLEAGKLLQTAALGHLVPGSPECWEAAGHLQTLDGLGVVKQEILAVMRYLVWRPRLQWFVFRLDNLAP
jgi:hypothetical protein